MESTTQSKSYLSLGILLSPILLPFLGGFALYSWKHRRGYRGLEEFSARYSFFKKVFWASTQLTRQENHLRMGDYLTQKNTLIILYCPNLKWGLFSLSFLLTEAYKKHFQRARYFKFCILSSFKPKWMFLLSSLEILEKIPSTQFLKESLYPVLCFSNSIEKVRELALSSYRTVIFLREASEYSWLKGIKREFQAIGSLNIKEKLGNVAQTELKLDRILELLN